MERIVLVQLSDIHMGNVYNSRYQNTHPKAGLNGHDPLLLDPLSDALKRVRTKFKMTSDESLFMVLSGDLSCSGLHSDFAQAYTFLFGEVFPKRATSMPVGLRQPTDRFWAEPGNHDQWNGGHRWPYQPAYNSGLASDFFEKTPWCSYVGAHPGGALRLELFGVDSNSGWGSGPSARPSNPSAGGAFSPDELHHPTDGLEALLRQSDEYQSLPERQGTHLVRAVICHHSFSNVWKPRLPPPASFGKQQWNRLMAATIGKFPYPLRKTDVDDLIRLCWAHQVRAVLTGHTHYFHPERFANPSDSTQFVWEIRCSTSIQDPVQGATHGFVVHEIRLDAGATQPVWEFTNYTYLGGSFAPGVKKPLS
jgi:hypothetical protein